MKIAEERFTKNEKMLRYNPSKMQKMNDSSIAYVCFTNPLDNYVAACICIYSRRVVWLILRVTVTNNIGDVA